jgi:hypothetical protein
VRVRYYLKDMLLAQIEIVDETGHIEESMTIIGSGRVSLGRRQTGGYLHVDEIATDLAVIVQGGGRVSIEVKVENSLQHEATFVARGSLDLASAQNERLGFVEQVRRYVEVKQVFVSGELLSGSAIVRNMVPSSLPNDMQPGSSTDL